MRMARVFKVAIIIIIILIASIVVLPVMFSQYIIGTPLPALELPELNEADGNGVVPIPDGTWTVVSDSVAGFRIGEYFLLQRGIMVGRTHAVTGLVDISSGTITSASFQVDLSKVVITINEKSNNLERVVDMINYPYATFELSDPVDVTQLSADGQTVSSEAKGSLTINNITHHITFILTGGYDGSQLAATGSAAILLADWDIKSPFGIEKDAEIEFLVILQKA